MFYVITEEFKLVQTDNLPNTFIRYSETLEDLINRYVTYNRSSYKIYTKLQFGKLNMRQVKKWLEQGVLIYGAIWTRTGLIYAAQMNRNGKLQLICN